MTTLLSIRIPDSKNVIKELIHFCLKDDVKQFIVVTKIGTTNTPNKNKFKAILERNFKRNFGNFHLDNSLYSTEVLSQKLLL